jgi:hypothetical protein
MGQGKEGIHPIGMKFSWIKGRPQRSAFFVGYTSLVFGWTVTMASASQFSGFFRG